MEKGDVAAGLLVPPGLSSLHATPPHREAPQFSEDCLFECSTLPVDGIVSDASPKHRSALYLDLMRMCFQAVSSADRPCARRACG